MKKILINTNPWETRIGITWNNQLENIYFSSPTDKTLERTFFKGVVTKVLPGIQTAFVDIGQEKAGFLHISEIDREMAIENLSKYSQLDEDEKEAERPRKRLNISNILKEGDPILVQVNKEPVYEKGAKLTTCFTLPGRFIVLMPNIPRIGVSKKIEDREERIRLKTVLKEHLPEGMGAIIRTTSLNRNNPEILKDLRYLVDTWNTIQAKFEKGAPKEMLYQDIPLTFQIVRDHLGDDIEDVIVDNKKVQYEIYKFVRSIAPEFDYKIKFYDGVTPLFQYYDIEKQIDSALHKKVYLKSGGSLIIESTEAMTVVDVNTGRFIGKSNLEDTIFKTNTEAAQEIVKQLKLRNIGGLIVIDFIDMAMHANKQKLFNFFEKVLKDHDKFQSVVLKISEFGLVQMTRKRSGKTLVQQLTNTCPTCFGSGFVRSATTEAFTLLRKIVFQLKEERCTGHVTIQVNPKIFETLTTTQFNSIFALEKQFEVKITLATNKNLSTSDFKLITN